MQEAVRARRVPLQAGSIDRDLQVVADRPNGVSRLSYVLLEGDVVAALVTVVPGPPVGDLPAFTLHFAVPADLRGHGRAQRAVRGALTELQHGFARNGILSFYATALVDADNLPAQRVAARAITADPTPETDVHSGRPALRYLRKLAA